MLVASKLLYALRVPTLRSLRPIPLFKYTKPISKRFLSTHHDDRTVTQEQEPRDDRDRINRFLLSIDESLENGEDDSVVQNLVHRQLSDEKLMIPSRHIAFEKVISLLMARRYFKGAATAYQRMLKEGLIPSSSTNAQMLAVTLAVSSDSEDQLTAGLDQVFSDQKYTEFHLRELLDLIADLQFSARTSLTIAERFIESRKSPYTPSKKLMSKLVAIQARTGFVDEALDTLVRNDDHEHSEVPSAEKTHPYAAILTSIKDTQPQNTQIVDMVLDHMKKYDVRPDVSVFNVLIAREVRERSLFKAFKLYEVLMYLSKNTPSSPDRFTFGSLFTVLARLYKPNVRTARSRQYKHPANVLSPRQLYHDMISCHLKYLRISRSGHTSSEVITPSILNVALRTFLSKGDYVGALIVVRTFHSFDLKVTPKTYYIVMRHVMNKIRWELHGYHRGEASQWAHRVLGLNPQTVNVHEIEVDEKLAEKVLSFSGHPACDTRDNTNSVLGHAPSRLVTPTLAMIDGEALVPVGVSLDYRPLERILRRAIRAHLDTLHSSTDGQPVSDVDDSSAFRASRAIADAKEEMIPKDMILPKQKLDRRRYRSKKYCLR